MVQIAGEHDDDRPVRELPPGVTWSTRIRGADRRGIIAWSSDGTQLACATPDECRIWEFDRGTGEFTLVLTIPSTSVNNSVAWSPVQPDALALGQEDGVTAWALDGSEFRQAWSLTRESSTGRFHEVSFAPAGNTLVVADGSPTLVFVGVTDGRVVSEVPIPINGGSVHWSPAGDLIFAFDFQGSGVLVSAFGRHSVVAELGKLEAKMTSAGWSPDGRVVAVGDVGAVIRIWSARGNLQAVLEGHTGVILSITFSDDGALMYSSATDRTTRCWRTDSWNCVGVIPAPYENDTTDDLVHSPTRPVLAWRSGTGDFIDILDVDPQRLLSETVTTRTYANAKVVLIGDTGVGKSGLGLVLSGQGYEPTDSTHARQVFTFDDSEIDVPGGTEKREILLWDLAGQPGYRLIHQLHLAEAAAALVVFDARSEQDPFGAVRYWMRALKQCRAYTAGRAVPPALLVAARVDRGGIPASRNRVLALCDELGLSGYFETSARQGWKISELAEAVRSAIDWSALPRSISTTLFDTIKQFLLDEKNSDRVLATADDLFRSFQRRQPFLVDDDLRPHFDTCIRLLEGRDLLRRLSFGGFVLLRPELLDAYASALIDAARGQPDGLGYLAEEDAVSGLFMIPDDQRLTGNDERLLLVATVEELLRHDLALREITDGSVDLVFPSQFTVKEEGPADTTADVILHFEGSISTVYATLAVRLSRVAAYERDEMWRNASTYRAKVGGVCGLRVREPEDGVGELTVFFGADASEETRYTFEDYVQAHVTTHALPRSVRRERVFNCPGCGYRLDSELVRRKQARDIAEITCPDCEEKRILLLDREDRLGAKAMQSVQQMNASADQGRDREAATATIRGKELAGDYDLFLSFNSADRQLVNGIAEGLRDAGLLPWVDARALLVGQEWQTELAGIIRRINTVAVFIGPHGLGRWQKLEVEATVDEATRRRNLKVLPVLLPGTPDGAEIPPFLDRWQFVDFREAWPPPFDRLLQAITGEPRR
jgi:WD40 repeat protein